MPGTIPTNYVRCVMVGKLPGNEEWQTTLALSDPSGNLGTQGGLDAWLGDNADKFRTCFDAFKGVWYTGTDFHELRAYWYPASSPTASVLAVVPITPVVAGSSSSAGSPLDTCIVVSTRSTTPSRSGRGRMYIPMHSAISPTGVLGGTIASDIGTAVAALMSGLNGTDDNLRVSVASRTRGQLFPIVECITDNVPDVQRRRIKNLASTSTVSHPVTAPS